MHFQYCSNTLSMIAWWHLSGRIFPRLMECHSIEQSFGKKINLSAARLRAEIYIRLIVIYWRMWMSCFCVWRHFNVHCLDLWFFGVTNIPSFIHTFRADATKEAKTNFRLAPTNSFNSPLPFRNTSLQHTQCIQFARKSSIVGHSSIPRTWPHRRRELEQTSGWEFALCELRLWQFNNPNCICSMRQ